MNRKFCILSKLQAAITLAVVGFHYPAICQLPNANHEAVEVLISKLQPSEVASAAGTAPNVTASVAKTSEGHVRWLSAPAGREFAAEAALVPGQPDATARGFMRNHRLAFGIASDAVDFTPLRTRIHTGRHNVRLQQTYADLPVFGAQVIVELNTLSGIECVLSKIQRDTAALDQGRVSVSPVIDSTGATTRALQALKEKALASLIASPPRLQIYAPGLLQIPGEVRLTWTMEITEARLGGLEKQALVDARTGEIAAVFDLSCTLMNRQIRDQSNSSNTAPVVVRNEGSPAAALAQANSCYTNLGDVYLYYWLNHFRDSYDEMGGQIVGVVRWCDASFGCPAANAISGTGAAGSPMLFGDGFAVDDVVAHEFTHKVTANESGLIYTNAPGGINESLSDIFGEFVDQWNGHGNDAQAVLWDIGEELPNGRIRSMKDPPALQDPDRLGSPFFRPPSNTSDNGGVHHNSGVNNKLCYLITQGDQFNGRTVFGFPMQEVSELYYELQFFYLTPTADFSDLYLALRQGGMNRFSKHGQINLAHACLAVEIASFTGDVWVDGKSLCPFTGHQTCTVTTGPYKTIAEAAAISPVGTVVHIVNNGANYNERMLTITNFVQLRAEGGPVTIGKH